MSGAAEAGEGVAGWIKWSGGECPLQEGARHQVRYRDGLESEVKHAIAGARSDAVWVHDPDMARWDIVAYRVVPAAAASRAEVQA